LSAKKDAAPHTLPKGRLDHDSSPGIKKSLLKVDPGNSHQEIINVQSPNPEHLIHHGTAGLPKGRKSYGNGAFVVDGINNSTEGRQANAHKGNSIIIPQGCDGLKNLWKSNQHNLLLVNHKLIHLVRDMEVLILAYELIKSNPGNMTPGPTKETLDGQTLKMLQDVSRQLRAGKYKFSPSRRVWIPKPGKTTKRPLGVVAPREKVVQKALQLVLEAIYEPRFSNRSHGFRPAKGTHTALQMVDQKFQAASWVIEADISKCFDTIDHGQLLRILSKRIACEKTLALLRSALEAGYIDLGRFVSAKGVGTPQGSVLSPLLCNIYMNELDTFVAKLQLEYTTGKRRRANPIYNRIRYLMRNEPANSSIYKQLRTKMRSVLSTDWMDPKFRRVTYVRYADDFVIGVAGPRSLAVQIQEKVRKFLAEELKLEMSKEKTLLTHFTHKPITFLGTYILNRGTAKNKPVQLVESKRIRTKIRLSFHAPTKKILEKLINQGFLKWNKNGTWLRATAVRRLINLEHADIIRYYQSIIYGILNYYSFVDNRPQLWWAIHGLKYSCARTLRLKYKLRFLSKTLRRFGRDLKDPATGVTLKVPKTLGRTGHYHINPTNAFTLMSQKWTNKVTKSRLGKACVICGVSPIEMHHVRKIKDLMNRKHLDWFTTQMAAINRKQVPLCKEHHIRLHNNTLTAPERVQYQEGLKRLVKSSQPKTTKHKSATFCD